MKKIFALILVVLMLLPAVVSCKPDEDETSSSSSVQQSSSSVKESASSSKQESSSSSSSSSSAVTPPEQGGVEYEGSDWSSKEDIMNDWNGQTLNVLVTPYTETPGAPWAQMELNPESFGETINKAYQDRQAFILDTYGVTVNWIQAQQVQAITNDLQSAATSSTTTFEIAMPRAHEVQSLVSLVYDMGGEDYVDLDFSKSYFSMAAYESFTVSERTLFMGGDFSFADDVVGYMLYYNKDMAEETGVPDLYEAVKTGQWTYDVLVSLSKLVKGDNGDGVQGDEDTYGFATKNFTRFYEHAGIFEADVDRDTGLYRIALNLDENKVDKVINNIIECTKGTDWARSDWGGDWGANATTAFNDGRVLFYHETVHQLANFGSVEFGLGVLPFPKLNSDQTRYYTPLSQAQTTFVCIPKCTKDRMMSEYFLDVLSWTGEDYIMNAWFSDLQAVMDMDTVEDDMEILQEHILDNIVFDAGSLTNGWGGFLGSVKGDSYKNGTNNFTQSFREAEEEALIAVGTWNENWSSYSE